MEELLIRSNQDIVLIIENEGLLKVVLYKGRKVCKIFYNFALFDFDDKIKDCVEIASSIERHIDKSLYLMPPSLFEYEIDIFNQEEIVQDCWIHYADYLKVVATSGGKRQVDMLRRLCESYFKFYSTQNYKSPHGSGRHLSSYDFALIESECVKARLNKHIKAVSDYIPIWKSGVGAGVRNKTGVEYIRFNKDENKFEATNGMLIEKVELVRCYFEIQKSGRSTIKGIAKDLSSDEMTEVEFPVTINEENDFVINCSVVKRSEVESIVNSIEV